VKGEEFKEGVVEQHPRRAQLRGLPVQLVQLSLGRLRVMARRRRKMTFPSERAGLMEVLV
jgi:hypothetical protein